MAERRPKSHSLERVLRARDLFATSYGDVGSSIYYALALVAGLALGMTPVVFMISGFIFVMTAATYAEATSMFPEAGGSSSFARHAFNEVWSVIAGWGQMLNYIITASISAFFVPHYLGVLWAPLRGHPYDIIAGVIIIFSLAAINIIGVKESSKINLFLAVADFGTQAILVIVGMVLVFSPEVLVNNVDFGKFPTLGNFLVAIPVGMVAYTGIETTSNLAEEAIDHARTIPRATRMTVTAVLAIYAFLPAVALSAMPVVNGTSLLVTKYAGDPVLGIVKQLDFGAFQHAAELYVGLLAGTILLIATNAGIIGVSRLTYSMGQHRQMPEIVRRLHPRFKTPYVAIIAFACIASLAILPGQADFLGKVYAFGAMLSFTIAHMSVIALRWKHPEYERTYRGPGLVMFRDHEVPIFAVIGFLGTFAAWLTVFGRDKLVFLGGLIWVGLGLAMYATYRHRIGLTLTESSSIVTPKAIVEHEVEYDSILVVFEDGAFSEEAVQTAVKMATRRRRGVHVLVTITVPASAPVNAVLPAAESAANSAIDRARVVGGRRVSGHWEKVRAGEAGRRIVHEAEEINARAIVIPVKRDSAGSLFSSAVQKVLSDRPCRVIITTGDPNPKLAEVS